MNTILDIALKDLVRSIRSMFAIGMMIVAPVMLTGLIYFAFGGMGEDSGSVPAVAVGIVNQDILPSDAPMDESLGATLRGMFFDESVQSWLTASDYASEVEARTAVDRQEIGVAVVIPPGFTAAVLNGTKEVQVLVISDPTLTVGPSIVTSMVSGLMDGVTGGGIAIETLLERQQANGQAPDLAQIPGWVESYQAWYTDFQQALYHNPDKALLVQKTPAAATEQTGSMLQNMMALTLAGQMIFFAFFTGGYSMMSILNEDEEGTLARLFTTPVNRTVILAGKFLAVVITVTLQGLVLMLFGTLVFKINWGEPIPVILAFLSQVIAASGLGVLLISLVKTSRQGGPVLGGGLTTLGMLGGLFTANIPNMPGIFDTLGYFVPQGWVLKGWKFALAGEPASALVVPFLVIAALGLVMFALGALRFRKRYA